MFVHSQIDVIVESTQFNKGAFLLSLNWPTYRNLSLYTRVTRRISSQ